MIDTKTLEDTFNLPPQIIEGEFSVVGEKENKELIVPEIKLENGKLEDSDYIRTNLKDLATSTKDALDLALQMQSDDPNAKNTEAVAKIADAVAKVLGNLIHLNKIEREENKNKPDAPTTVNNNLIITTEDLISKIISQTKQLKER